MARERSPIFVDGVTGVCVRVACNEAMDVERYYILDISSVFLVGLVFVKSNE